MKCKGLHCPGCGDGGGGLAVLVVVAIIIAAVARPVIHAAELVAEIALITVTSIVGLAVAAAVVYAAMRIHRRKPSTVRVIPSYRPAARRVRAISGPRRAAIEAPKPQLLRYDNPDGARDVTHAPRRTERGTSD